MTATAKRLGNLDGTMDQVLGSDRGAREAFIRRPQLGESEWATYCAAYEAAARTR